MKNFLIFILILCIAAFLRLYKIADYMTFLGDEGRDVLVVYNILHGDLTFLGPAASVGGFFLGPIYYYFMAPFLLLFNYNPVGPAVMVALFGIATVGLVYMVGRNFFDNKTAIIASFLYAISPIIIAYSRSSWNPNLMPFFSLLSLYLLYKAILKNDIRLFFFCGFLLGITIQLHYLTLFLLVIVGMYILLSQVLIEKKGETNVYKILRSTFSQYVSICIGFIVGLSPFLIFEIRHGFPNVKSIFSFIFLGSATGNNNMLFTIWDVFFRLFARLITKFPPPEQISLNDSIIPIDFYFFSFLSHVRYLYSATFLLVLGSVSLLVYQLYACYKNREKFLKILLLSSWLFFGVVLFGFYKKSIYDYYFGFMFPLPFLLVGNFLSFLFQKKKGFKWLGLSIFIILILLNFSGIPFRYPANRQLEQVKSIARFVYARTGGKPFNFALITEGNSDHAYRYFFKIWNNNPVTIQNAVLDPQRNTVTDQLFVICETNPCHPLGHPLWEIAGFGSADIQNEWVVSVVKVYKLVRYKNS